MSADREILDIQKQLVSAPQSGRKKYQRLIVGKTGLGALLRYEIITLLCSATPGAWGLALRKALYPRLLGSVGKNVVFGANIVLRHPHKIRIGDNVVIDDNCLLDAKGESNHGITIGSGVFIGRNTILHCKNGDIEIGNDANIGFNCDIASSSRIRIGPKTLLAAYSYIIGGGHDFSRAGVAVMDQQRVALGVDIGEACWIGAHVTVQDGVTIGDHTIIGTAAVVNENLPPHSVAVGIPARVIRTRTPAEEETPLDS